MTESKTIPVACFAPPLTDAALATYRKLVEALPATDPVRDAGLALLRCVGAWWELPESARRPAMWAIRHRGKDVEFPVVPLEAGHVKTLWDVTPWMYELNAMEPLLDAVPAGKLRDALYHLLWHCKELTLDREPTTADKLPA